MTPSTQSALDPSWVAAVVAAFALIVSIIALWLTRRNRRSELEQAFVQQRNEINLAFAQYQVKGPFAQQLGIASDELKEYIPKACLLFLQVNLLNDVYQHRRYLPGSSLQGYEAWAKKILAPWVHSDQRLIETLRLIYATDDLMPKAFVEWMKERIPLTSTGPR